MNDLSNQKQNFDVIIPDELSPKRLWISVIAIGLLSLLGVLLLMEGNYVLGISLLLAGGFVWLTLK
jgi:hypothetical protein|tara:strand:- start:1851 stop:2048 length:198 start_codon:yes stop_codon:yes gene_type:complete